MTSVPSRQSDLLVEPTHTEAPKALLPLVESGHHMVFLPHSHRSVEAH